MDNSRKIKSPHSLVVCGGRKVAQIIVKMIDVGAAIKRQRMLVRHFFRILHWQENKK